MKVLVEQSGYDLLNFGDLAMLQFTVARLRKEWPQSDIAVLTTSEKQLKSVLPSVRHLMIGGRDGLIKRDRFFGRLSPRIASVDRRIWRRYPKVAESLMLWKTRVGKRHLPDVLGYRAAVINSDFVLASGGGYITDEFPDMVEGVCGTVAMAQRYQKPTAMFGQGLGPLKNPHLVKIAREAMQNVAVLGLREPVHSPGLALELGVPAERTTVTGDNATAMAFYERGPQLGNAIGINVRVATYSRVNSDELIKLRRQVCAIHERIHAPLVPILISQQERDDLQSAALCPPDSLLEIPMNSPMETIRAIGLCRIVITGSYHAAVFALGQGVPAIGIAKSNYYKGKFEGLAGLYPESFQMVTMEEIDSLADKAVALYDRANELRDAALQQSELIVNRSEELYARFFEMLPLPSRLRS